MSPAYRVMTVCTGNICRSPMAEIVLRQALAAAGLGRDVTVESTAVYSEEQGNPIDPRASRWLVAHGYAGGAKH
ncbi:MAG: low molecular weight phosphotyrosine protein phosphatase, partial [Promicromonosporaceae bacterium]|nr:low molecular weight phosphotyrosine protein phosphatase [Promicromonosporaceae bacterium]